MATQYKILNSHFNGTDTTQLDDFAKMVEEWLNGGWIPIGGPVVVDDIIFQAVATDIHFNPASVFRQKG